METPGVHGQEVHECHKGVNHDVNEDKESPSGANEGKEEDKVATVVFGNHMSAAEKVPSTVKDEMQGMFLRLEFIKQ